MRWFFWLLMIVQLPLLAHAAPAKTSRSPMPASSKIIVLDPGHGGLNKGAEIKYPHTEEKRLTLMTALMTKKYLDQLGYKVILTRSNDVFIPLMQRVQKANFSHASLFVSIHFNSCPNPTAQGIEIFYHPKAKNPQCTQSSQQAAKHVLQGTAQRTGLASRGVKSGNYCVIRETNMPAILVEGGFLTNTHDRDVVRQRENLDKLAKGIAEGIDRFMKS